MDVNKKISPQSKSFIILFVLAIVGTYLCFMLWGSLTLPPNTGIMANSAANPAQTPLSLVPTPTPVPPVDTSAWQTYTSAKYNFSFKYPSDWKILAAKSLTGGYDVIQVDPGAKYYNIKIYVSPQGYYIMGGLPTTSETIGGQPAQNVKNELYGITDNGLYYTFDVGWSMSLVPKFDALVHSVEFLN
jgi:hypothetical protein